MVTEERLKKQIKIVYTEIVRKAIDRTFKFPDGGKVDRQLSQFIQQFTKTFGKTAFSKYQQMSSKQKTYAEDQWLKDVCLTRSYLNSLISINKQAHPLAKYIYMPAEEGTKRRCVNTDIGLVICTTSTLMWSPFSATCQSCEKADECKLITEEKYPELYRIRIEEYGENEK